MNIDLALEARDLIRGATGQEIPGVLEEKQTFQFGTVTIIKITDIKAATIMGKPPGTYITVESPDLRFKSFEVQKCVGDIVAYHLKNLLRISEDATVLIIGLGNWQATPDALGPTVVKYSLITRHFHQHMPQIAKDYRPVCAFAPGVLGITGIESAEIIQGIVSRVRPSAIIAIDSLAATNLSRLGTTIQIGDTGITPGSGVNNKRIEINFQTMGVPVIAIGVPTVVNASVIATMALEHYSKIKNLTPLTHLELNALIQEIFKAFEGSLIVTPREIDDLILNAGRTINRGITLALHPRVPREELEALLC